jgi:hypothetical protein
VKKAVPDEESRRLCGPTHKQKRWTLTQPSKLESDLVRTEPYLFFFIALLHFPLKKTQHLSRRKDAEAQGSFSFEIKLCVSASLRPCVDFRRGM